MRSPDTDTASTPRPVRPSRPKLMRAQEPLTNFLFVILTCGMTMPLAYWYGAPRVRRVNRRRLEQYSIRMEQYQRDLAEWEATR